MTRKRARVTSRASTRREMQAEMVRRKARERRRVITQRLGLLALVLLLFYVLLASYGVVGTKTPGAQWTAFRNGMFLLSAKAGFRIEDVNLMGRQVADKAAVEAALGVVRGAPILAISLPAMQSSLERIPEIRMATVSRQLPNRLDIAIEERVPVVLWQSRGQTVLMDADAVVLNRKKYMGLGDLPLLVGDDAPQHLAEFMGLLQVAPQMAPEILAAIRVGQRRWNIKLKNEMTILLPAENPTAAWKRFAELSKRESLLSKAIRSVDMRIEDRVFITPLMPNQSLITLTNARDT
ncbi:MAG: cell division protein FtsQ/DivIB [Alphaproteobacteria bacterium]